jgi:hypothetical protein
MDNSFKRGIFFVEITKEFKKFAKKVKMIRLKNRNYLWETIYLNYDFRNKKKIEAFILEKLSSSFIHLNNDIHPSNPQMPKLYLILKGKEPNKLCKISEKELKVKICGIYPIVDVQIYQKFEKSLRTLDNYILA